MKKIYETATINRGGHDGKTETPNGNMHVEIDRPGTHSEGTSPEQLFAAGHASCFSDTAQHMLEENNLESDPKVKAWTSLFQLEDRGYQIGAVLEASLLGPEKDQAEKIAEETRVFCPYFKATRDNIDVKVTIVE